jgi:hypothetical protein
MLPVNIGNLDLNDELRARLDQFFNRYCSSAKRENQLGHLIFACHASFPLLLSPNLANLIWLNFKNYSSNNKIQTIERVAVSDLLLSSLVRPVVGKQYEVVPEIRSYLLYLLKDSRWFESYGIENFGQKRLQSLANFLRQYLADKKSQSENNATGFREVNEWSALAYLEPDALAYKIAQSLKSNLDSKNELGQLRLNVLMDRLGQQYDLNIYDNPDKKPQLFINLHKYGNANRSRLFGESSDQISKWLVGLDDAFIKTDKNASSLIELPIQREIGERLQRKKNKIQRVISLLIAIDDYPETTNSQVKLPKLMGSVPGAMGIQNFLRDAIDSQTNFESSEINLLLNEQATTGKIMEMVENIVRSSQPEDIILIFFSGHGRNSNIIRNEIIAFDYNPDNSASAISNTSFRETLWSIKPPSERGQIILVLDTHTGYYDWVEESDILIGGVNHTTQREFQIGDHRSTAFADSLKIILAQTNGRISYSDLMLWLHYRIENDYGDIKESSVCKISAENKNNFLFSHERVPNEDAYFLFHNAKTHVWQVLAENFNTIKTGIYSVYDYNSGEVMPEISGEVYFEASWNTFNFAPRGAYLDEHKIYKAKMDPPPIIEIEPHQSAYQSNAPVATHATAGQENLLKKIMEYSRKPFALWGRIEINSLNDFNGIDFDHDKQSYYWQGDSGFSLLLQVLEQDLFQLKIFYDKFVRRQLQGNLDQVFHLIDEFSKYYRLNELAESRVPGSQYVTVELQWATGTPFSRTLSVSLESMFIKDRTIHFYPMRLKGQTNSAIRTYYAEYILVSDFTIQFLPSPTDAFNPNQDFVFERDITDVLTYAMNRDLQLKYVMLVSPEPILMDFSNVLNQPSYVIR